VAEGDGQDKRHAPTERRLRQAASRGDVLRSSDVPKAASVAFITVVGLGAAAGVGMHLEDFVAGWLADAGTAAPGAAAGWAIALGIELAPLLLMIVAVTVAAAVLSGGWVFSVTQLMPDFSKLLPSFGLGQIFSPTGLTDTVKGVLKFCVIGGIGFAMIWAKAPEFAALAATPKPGPGPVIAITLAVLAAMCVGIVALAAGDFALQYWLHRQKLRMSDAEVREEMKEQAGNPQVRQRQRMLARKLARARQMSRIPEASVIVTNPTHYAVAIRYRRGVDRAPLLLAKGVGLLAEEILSRGRGLGIPVVEAPPLARAVYRHVEPGEHIPVALYRACAEVLAYVWRMQRWRAQGGKRPVPPKAQEGEIEVRPGAWPGDH
jgi:flagellar biosynthetic protein FlhB